MNRLILKYAYPMTVVIFAIFAWVIYQRISRGVGQIVPLAIAAGIVWILGTPTFIYVWPRLTVNGFKRAILKHGFGGPRIPVNTLYAAPNPSSASAPRRSLLATGTEKLLYIGGWLDLSDGPQILHVPDTGGRYYSVQLTNPSDSANFAYVGKRTSGTAAGDYVICGPGWKGTVPDGMARISSPNRSVLVIGRVFVDDKDDLPAAYRLAKQIRLDPLSR